MKGFFCRSRIVLIFLVLFPVIIRGRNNFGNLHSHPGRHHQPQAEPSKKDSSTMKPDLYRAVDKMHKRADPLEIAGSSLPDCTHACGSCTPCRLVMVSFVCSSLEEAETCPMAYKCMCNNKSYPVP